MYWLVVLTILKHISQWEGLSQILCKIKNLPNHQPDVVTIATEVTCRVSFPREIATPQMMGWPQILAVLCTAKAETSVSWCCGLSLEQFLSHRIHCAAIYMGTFTINIPQMLAYIPYMDPMGIV